MESTRIFVRNLPPTLTEQEFRQHFTKRFVATDLKHFSKRRIGYVGFKTADDAEKAVKYFNKSFICMSRLHVELAKDVEDAPGRHDAPKTTRGEPNASSVPVAPQESSLDSGDHAKGRPHTVLKRKREAHDGVMADDPQSGPSPNTRPEAKQEQPDDSAGERKEGTADRVPEQKPPADNEAEIQAPSTDTDWMRSRTSRLLGLADDDDNDDNPNLSKSHTSAPALTSQHGERPELSETHGQQSPEQKLEQNSQTRNQNIEEIPSVPQSDLPGSDRLFLRNLAYSVTESELSDLLQTFGSVSEVRPILVFIHFLFRDEVPDRDNLCNALDVNRSVF